MRTEIIGAEGWLRLGDEAQAAGFGPDVLIDIVVLSTGNLLITKTADRPDALNWAVPTRRHRWRTPTPRPQEVDNGHKGE